MLFAKLPTPFAYKKTHKTATEKPLVPFADSHHVDEETRWLVGVSNPKFVPCMNGFSLNRFLEVGM
jgi:hypothetical protein